MTDFPISPEFPVSPAAPAAAATPAARAEPFSFTGKTGEYFRIWIVNLFLTIVTLGIYSAWAKVRKKRYLYGNTWVAGSNFEYHGDPVAILKGRLVAFAAFVAYTLASQYSPKYAAGIFLALVPAVPWIVARSFAFNAVNSSWRNLRFRFRATYAEALAALAPIALIPLATLALPVIDAAHPPESPSQLWLLWVPPALFALVYPYVVAKVTLLRANRSFFGMAAFACEASVARFYGIYALGFLLFLVALMALGAAMTAAMFVLPMAGVVVGPLGYFVGAALVMGFTRSRIANLVFNTTRLEGGVSFSSGLAPLRLARIYGFNLLAIALTLGLAVPWAVMRTARYRAECLALRAQGGLDAFVGTATREVAAAGEEMGEMFDIDLSL
jgi:uncharacterized membrane protein YjgN (DUF898 family)